MWSTVWTLWPIPFACALDVTVLLDNWKIALSFVVVRCTFKLLIRWTCQSHSPLEMQGQKDWVAVPRFYSDLSVSGADTVPVRRMLWYILHHFMASAWVPAALHTLLPLPSRCSACGCRCSMDMGWQERCALLHILCASCSKVPRAFPWETSIPGVTNSAWQTPSVWGFPVHRQKLFVYLILILCLHSRQWLCAHVYSLIYAHSHSCTFGSLYI